MFTTRTGRLVLRPFSIADAAAFAAYRSEPAVARFQSWEAPYPVESARELIAEMLMRGSMPRAGEWNQIAVAAAAGELIGDCAFRLLTTEPGAAQLGFTLSRRHWGKGYATEAARAVVGWLFDSAKVGRVVADCDSRNVASQRVLERLGMKRVGHREVVFKGEVAGELRFQIDRGSGDPERRA